MAVIARIEACLTGYLPESLAALVLQQRQPVIAGKKQVRKPIGIYIADSAAHPITLELIQAHTFVHILKMATFFRVKRQSIRAYQQDVLPPVIVKIQKPAPAADGFDDSQRLHRGHPTESETGGIGNVPELERKGVGRG